MAMPFEKPADRSRSVPQGLIIGICVLVLLAAFLGWQVGHRSGERQTADILLASPDAETEVVLLRAQLDEMRRSQDALLNVVLAAFAAGFTVLVLVNVGGLVLAQRNYDRDERAMRIVLREDAKALVDAEAKSTADALAREHSLLDELSRETRDISVGLAIRLGQADTRIDELYSQSSAVAAGLGEVRITTLRMQIRDAESEGDVYLVI